MATWQVDLKIAPAHKVGRFLESVSRYRDADEAFESLISWDQYVDKGFHRKPFRYTSGLYKEDRNKNDREILNSKRFLQQLSNTLEGILPQEKHWDENAIMWGSYDGDRVEVLLEKGHVAEITIRFDLRKFSELKDQGNDKKFIYVMIEFVQSQHAIFVDHKALIPPLFESLFDHISNSSAHMFVKEPELYFEGLNKYFSHRD
ncbi:hypothetical protein [Deinococcus hopiensis]|uniref:Uncharacterized protein n=1 Tax=Deinococcus hopiensis KR-140 TaxID=695939 RepID=A0A1W1VLR5_9DEIO|nr:hypothetical protein [Deinococcus hopiensis]SMB94160.1 hypothetical protein SAMN00790413_02269 [Deinococcus hopiensis KR-140]